ncbi:MAG TPA: biotin--[acetyl-CoA-carboxylase] ligase [Desulfovibrio sp.]|jgi:BirA family biotin operon repressor/biotin-[acetyl-CoA-carboxylase] ligase|uniref:biotin--[acetyl-CoA-carboxylase] ligase n=1 Tax=Desulfovibrio TaxID=872 RepID=UPI002B92EE5F|nr:biotin--[acetyl-CoA-carboxylase] ligase [Desulfovibrio sp.]HMM37696.1 biotin--[acetyl-CoA-carboxylase] ligase [Desulfovibrio sp.]
MTADILLWAGGDAATGPLTPDTLASAHALWARDAVSFGPWLPSDFVLPPGDSRPVWRSARAAISPVFLVGHCFSTMDLTWKLLDAGVLPEWGSVLAVSQERGRGQLRRHWVSPPGNLYASLVLPPPRAGWGELLPLLAGWCFSLALEGLGVPTRLKWPNDFLLLDQKVAGMLIEERGGRLVLGFGLNLAEVPAAGDLRRDRAIPATALLREGYSLTPLEAWNTLVNAVRKVYTDTSDVVDPSRFPPLVTERLAWMGRRVLVLEGGEVAYQARIAGLSSSGGLLVEHDGRLDVLYSGSVAPL